MREKRKGKRWEMRIVGKRLEQRIEERREICKENKAVKWIDLKGKIE